MNTVDNTKHMKQCINTYNRPIIQSYKILVN